MLVIWALGAVAAGGSFWLGWLDPLTAALVGAVSTTVGVEVRAITERTES